jgi:hypothetical protein
MATTALPEQVKHFLARVKRKQVTLHVGQGGATQTLPFRGPPLGLEKTLQAMGAIEPVTQAAPADVLGRLDAEFGAGANHGIGRGIALYLKRPELF